MAAPSSTPLITVLDQDPVLIRLLTRVLHDAGYRTQLLPSGSAAYEEIRDAQPSLVVLDTWLETREAGWVLLQILRLDEATSNIPVLICSSDLDEYQKRASALGAHSRVDVLNKPFDIDTFVTRINQMLGRAESPTPKAAGDGTTPE